ncbi:MAG: molybdopterin-dependent oxidoreductase, partial [Pseudonocardiaceae bacterium]
MTFPTRPVWLYRLNQGVHVATGIAAIPLLLAKLWTVYPRLFSWPIARSLGTIAERASIALFVTSSLLQLFMGLLNTMQWYPWPFYFRQTHFFLAWVMIGSLLIHIAVKLPLIAQHWRRARAGAPADGAAAATAESAAAAAGGWSRRGFFGAIGVTVATVTVTTVGQSLAPLRGLNLFAPRIPKEGPQGLAVNRTAAEAGVVQIARSPQWRLEIAGVKTVTLTLEDLNAMPQT